MLCTTMVTNEQHCMEILNIFDRISINFLKICYVYFKLTLIYLSYNLGGSSKNDKLFGNKKTSSRLRTARFGGHH